MVSLEFFIDIILPIALCGPGVDLASNRNEFQEHFLGAKVAGAYKGDRGSTVVKVLCYKSEGCWFDPAGVSGIFD